MNDQQVSNKPPYELVCLLGGTFDPIHNGHLAIAQTILESLPVSHIEFIPAKQPPHRPTPGASPQQRLEMLQLVVAGHPRFIINTIEFERPGPSYMIDTLKALYALRPTSGLALIIGFDAFLTFNQWHRWEEILNFAHLIVMSRPNYQLNQAATWLTNFLQDHQCVNSQQLLQARNGRIFLQTMPAIATSATDIRAAIQRQQTIETEVPPNVLDYIIKHQLYS